MKYQRVKASFYRYPDSQLLVAAGRIVQAMKTSEVYTDPRPSLAEVEAAYVDYKQKLLEASGGGLYYRARKRESKRRLSDLLQALAYHVNVACDGDLVRLYQSGFPVLAKRRKGKAPTTPQSPFLRDGRVSGEVASGFKPVGRDMLYEYCFATETDDMGLPLWGEIRTTTRSFTQYTNGFRPGNYIYFRVRARNRHGASHWTPAVMWMVR